MSLLSLINVCLCCHVYSPYPESRKTVLSFQSDGFGFMDMEITRFKQDDKVCSATMRKANTLGNISCPDGTIYVSKPALTFNKLPSTSTQPVILSCLLATDPEVFVQRYVSLATPLQTGSTVTIIATPATEERIIMYLKTDSLDRPLVYVIGFTYKNLTRVIVRTYLENKHTGTPELHRQHFPYEVNREFNTTIIVRHKDYTVHVDGVHLFTFEFKIPNSLVTKISIFGKIILKSVIVK